jgi:hypothetical protein
MMLWSSLHASAEERVAEGSSAGSGAIGTRTYATPKLGMRGQMPSINAATFVGNWILSGSPVIWIRYPLEATIRFTSCYNQPSALFLWTSMVQDEHCIVPPSRNYYRRSEGSAETESVQRCLDRQVTCDERIGTPLHIAPMTRCKIHLFHAFSGCMIAGTNEGTLWDSSTNGRNFCSYVFNAATGCSPVSSLLSPPQADMLRLWLKMCPSQ